MGVITPVEPCGGQGQLLELRVSDNDGAPVTWHVDQEVRVELDFVPKYSHPGIELNLVVETADGEISVVSGEIPESPVNAGVTYTFGHPLVPGSLPVGQDFKIHVTIHGPGGAVQEVCVRFAARVVD